MKRNVLLAAAGLLLIPAVPAVADAPDFTATPILCLPAADDPAACTYMVRMVPSGPDGGTWLLRLAVALPPAWVGLPGTDPDERTLFEAIATARYTVDADGNFCVVHEGATFAAIPTAQGIPAEAVSAFRSIYAAALYPPPGWCPFRFERSGEQWAVTGEGREPLLFDALTAAEAGLMSVDPVILP